MRNEEHTGELNVVPFLDIVMNVMMFVLASIAITVTTAVDVHPPSSRPKRDASVVEPSPLALNVIVVEDGFMVSAMGRRDWRGVIGRHGGEYDYAGLTACAARLKAAAPEEKSVVIAANPSVPYQTIVHTMDALRRTDEGADLFPDVSFGVPR